MGEEPKALTPCSSPAVLKTLSPESGEAAVCGALGCRESPEFAVHHPDYGRRVVCLSHAQSLLRKPPQGEESRGRAASGRARGREGPEAAVPTPPERPERPEAGDPERSPATEAEPQGGPSGADLVNAVRWRGGRRE